MRLEEYLELISLNEGINDKGIFKAVIMCGMPGSGKSYTLKKINVGGIEPRIVNTDKVYPLFKEWWDEGWPKIRYKVKTLNKKQLSLYLNSILPLAVDGTANRTDLIIRRNGILESLGYDTAMVFINTSLETALERAEKRERPVNPEFIKEVYEKINKAKSFYKNKFHIFMEINNDIGELTDEVILKGFKFMSKFYSSPIKNPIGKEYKNKMIENGWKYLSPNIMKIEQIENLIDNWYRI